MRRVTRPEFNAAGRVHDGVHASLLGETSPIQAQGRTEPDHWHAKAVTNIFHYVTCHFVIGSAIFIMFYEFDNIQTFT